MPNRQQKKAAKSAAKSLNARSGKASSRLYGKPVMKEKDGKKIGYGTVAKKYPKYKGSTPSKRGVSKKVRKTY